MKHWTLTLTPPQQLWNTPETPIPVKMPAYAWHHVQSLSHQTAFIALTVTPYCIYRSIAVDDQLKPRKISFILQYIHVLVHPVGKGYRPLGERRQLQRFWIRTYIIQLVQACSYWYRIQCNSGFRGRDARTAKSVQAYPSPKCAKCRDNQYSPVFCYVVRDSWV